MVLYCQLCQEGIRCALMGGFHIFLGELADSYHGSKKDLARALKISPSRLSRMLKPGCPPPDVAVCLRLAAATATLPSKVLRAAGRDEIADLAEDLYGPAAERRQALVERYGLSAGDKKMLQVWRAMRSSDYREALLVIMRGFKELENKSSASGADDEDTTPGISEEYSGQP